MWWYIYQMSSLCNFPASNDFVDKLLEEMDEGGITQTQNLHMFTVLINHYGKSQDGKRLVKVFEQLKQQGLANADKYLWNTMIQSFSRLKLTKQVDEVFREMKFRGTF
jgi:pentatricopeptide repeat protein